MDEKDQTQKRDSWDKLQIVFQFVGVFIIGAILTWQGNSIQHSIRTKELNLRYVEMAINILMSAPTEENASLRQWAIDMLDNYSELKFKQQARLELRKVSIAHPLDTAIYGRARGDVARVQDRLNIAESILERQPSRELKNIEKLRKVEMREKQKMLETIKMYEEELDSIKRRR